MSTPSTPKSIAELEAVPDEDLISGAHHSTLVVRTYASDEPAIIRPEGRVHTLVFVGREGPLYSEDATMIPADIDLSRVQHLVVFRGFPYVTVWMDVLARLKPDTLVTLRFELDQGCTMLTSWHYIKHLVKNVRSITYNSCSSQWIVIRRMLCACPRLGSFTAKCTRFNGAQEYIDPPTMPDVLALRQLVLAGSVAEIITPLCSDLFPRCGNLEDLSLEGCTDLTSLWMCVFQHTPRLRCVRAPEGESRSRYNCISDMILRGDFKTESLRQFVVPGTDMSNEALRILGRRNPSILELDVSGCQNLTPDGLSIGVHFLRLARLHARDCSGIDDDTVASLLSGKGSLRYLDISENRGLTVCAFERYVFELQKVRIVSRVVVEGCPQVPSEVLEFIRTREDDMAAADTQHEKDCIAMRRMEPKME